MKGFITYSTYRLNDEKNKAFVYLFGRLENGESFLTITEYRPYFFIKTSDAEKAKTLVKAEFEDTKNKSFKDEALTKIIFNIPSETKENRDHLETNNVKTYESDVYYVMRFLIDHNITAAVDIDGKFKKGDFVNRIYEAPTLTGVDDFLPKLKVLSFDIEAESIDTKDKLYSISMYDGDYKEVFIVSNKKLENAKSFQDEKSLLEAFRAKIIELDPDILTGWNVIDFDLDYLKKKFDLHKIPFSFGRVDWPNKLRIESSFFMDSKAEVPGRVVLDGMQMLKNNFVNLPDYRLDTAATEILGAKKIISSTGLDKVKEIVDTYNNNQQKLVDYNLLDSKLVYDILEKKDLINLTMLRSLLTGMGLDRVSASVASLDSLYLRELRKKNIVANYNPSYERGEERAKGGFVMDSSPGIYDYILVLDFKSLYPSVMRTFNIDPYSLVEHPGKNLDKDKFITCENGVVFTNSDGFLPSIIERIWKQRDEAKKRKDETASYALKILMNSLYGAIGNPGCRYHNLDISNAITHTCQKMIKLAAEKIREKGYEIIYGDTDSVFVISKADNLDDALKVGKELESSMNKFLDAYITDEYHRKSFLELEFEKTYRRFMLPRTRSGGSAKKRYAGLLMKNGTEKIDVTGMEFVRGDWCEAAKQFQYRMLEMIFSGQESEIKKYIKEYVKDIKAGKMDEKLVLRKAIRKETVEYTKTTPPHVRAARKLEDAKIRLESNVIEYYMTPGNDPFPVELMKGQKIDYEYYIEKQIEPLADTVLSFYGSTFADLMEGHKQQGLNDFF